MMKFPNIPNINVPNHQPDEDDDKDEDYDEVWC